MPGKLKRLKLEDVYFPIENPALKQALTNLPEVRGLKAGRNTDFLLKQIFHPPPKKMGVEPKIGFFTSQIIHFNRVFHYTPSIFGVPIFLETPRCKNQCKKPALNLNFVPC